MREVVEVAAVLERLLEPAGGQVWAEQPQTFVGVAAAAPAAAGSAVVAVAAVVELVSERLAAVVAESA